MTEEKAIDWHADWTSFVKAVVSDFDSGKSDEVVSAIYCDKKVTWTGIVTKKSIDEGSPGIQLDMPEVKIGLGNDRVAVINYLYINLNPSNVESWKGVSSGASVKFCTTILKGKGPFPGLQWSEYENEGCVLIGTKDSTLVEVLSI